MVRKPSVSDERENFFVNVCHVADNTRNSVWVNTRNNVSDNQSFSHYCSGMKKGWFERLSIIIADDPRSYAELSRDAGLGANFIQQMIKNKKAPSGDNLEKILAQFSELKSIYVVTGLDLSGEELDLLESLMNLSAPARKNALALFQSLANQQDNPEPSPSADS